MVFTFQFEFDSGMFTPLVILLMLLAIFLRQGYKYRDTQHLFIAFVFMTLSALFAFIKPVGVLPSGTTVILSHLCAAATAFFLLQDTKHILKIQGARE